jgi:hypothetical protein
LVAASRSDRGLVDGTWYIENDRDDITIHEGARPAGIAREVVGLLKEGYGDDAVPDLMAITLGGGVEQIDAALDRILSSARAAAGGEVAVAVTATGISVDSPELTDREIADAIVADVGAPVIEATTPGGFFLDQEVLAETGITEDRILRAVGAVRNAAETRVFEDVFTAIAVTFERYC